MPTLRQFLAFLAYCLAATVGCVAAVCLARARHCRECVSHPSLARAELTRLFLLKRDEDVTGVSGTGVVAAGIRFANGMALQVWLRRPYSAALYGSIDDLEAIHGHGGKTRIEWINE